MSIFINTYKRHAGQSVTNTLVPRKVKKVLVHLGQSQDCECVTENTTMHLSLASRGDTEALGGTDFPKAPRTPHLPSCPRYQRLFSAFRNNDVGARRHSTYPLQGRHNFGGPAQGENAGPFFKHYCEEFQDGTKQRPF